MDTLIDNGNDSGINHEAFKQMLNHSYRSKIYDGVKIGSVDYKLDDNGLVVVSVGVPFGETKKFVKVYELADSFRTLAIMYGTQSKLMYNEHQGELYDNIVGSESERNLLSSITLSTAMNNVCDYMERIQYVSRTLGYNYKPYENEIFYDDFKDVNLDFYITENANNDSINVGVGHQFRGNKGDWVLSDSYEFDLFPAKPNMMSSLLDVSSVYIGQPKNSMEIAEQAMLQTIESEVSGVLKDIILVGTSGKITKVGLDYGKNVITLAEENSKKIEEQVLNKSEKVVEILHLGGTVSMIDGQYTINNCYVNRNFLENYAKIVIENFGEEYVLFRYDEETEQDKIKQMKSLAKEYEALIIGFFNGQYHVNHGDDKAAIEEKQKKEADFWGLVEAIEESKINTSSDADNDDTSFKTRQEILEERSQGENDEAKK